MDGNKPLFDESDLIFVYSRKQALEDGVQVDANVGDFADVTLRHFHFPVYMTRTLFDLIQKKVERRGSYYDYKGIWHDICWMARVAAGRSANRNATEITFQVKIGRKVETLVAMV